MRTHVVERQSGYHVFAAVDRVLQVDMGHRLSDLDMPDGCRIRPLRVGELRVRLPDGEWYIVISDTHMYVPEIPLKCHPLPFLHLDNDRCGSLWAVSRATTCR